MEKPSFLKSVLGGAFTAVKWLAFAAVVAGAIAAFAPGGAIAAGLGVAAEAAGFAAFKAGAIGLFTAGGTAGWIAAGIGALSFLKGTVSTHRAQEMEILKHQQEQAAAEREKGPSATIEKGAARGITFEASAGHPANDPNKKSVSFTTQVTGRREETASRSPGS